MKSVSLLLAWRYLSRTAYEKSISTMVRICFLGVFIGAFSLTLVTAIMQGFEVVIHEKMQGIHANVLIRSRGDALDVRAIGTVLENEFADQVEAWAPGNTGNVIVQSEEDTNQGPRVIAIRAIDPTRERLVSKLGEKILPNKENVIAPLEELVQRNHIIVGKELAKELNVRPNQKIQLLYTDMDQSRGKRIRLDDIGAVVTGVFDTGIEEFDTNMAFCSIEFFNRLFPEAGMTQMSLKLAPDASEQDTINALQQRLSLPVNSWKDLYPALVSALMLEKYVMFAILALITLVASMNILSLLFMEITNKRGDIAILKAMGAPDAMVSRIFLWIGMGITTIASVFGIACAYIASFFLERYPFIQLPDAYYVSHLPAKMEFKIAVAVFLTTLLLGLIATWLPTRRIRSINIAQVLRFEG